MPQAYGAQGSRVSAVEDLVPTLEAAFAGGGVHLVDVPIDYSENTRVHIESKGDPVRVQADHHHGGFFHPLGALVGVAQVGGLRSGEGAGDARG